MKVIANPVRLSETPVDYRITPSTVGAHTDDVLTSLLGMSEAEIAALRDGGVL